MTLKFTGRSSSGPASRRGWTFPNIDLIRDLSFSSGGFQAKYGDKMSSVLDVKYKRPDSLRASASASFLGASAHLEGSVKSKRDGYRAFRYLAGARYKTTRTPPRPAWTSRANMCLILPMSAYLTYDLSRDWQVGVIGNYNVRRINSFPKAYSALLV